MYSRISFFAVSAFCLLALTTTVSAFEISAYYDPYSVITNDWFRGNYYHSQCPDLTLHQVLQSVANNDDVLRWYDEMGITILCTSYDTLSQFQNLNNYHFRVMNSIYLNGSYRYLEAQERTAWLWQ